MVWRFQFAFALACLAAAAGCSEKKRTEIVVGLATDLAAPTPLGKVAIEVSKDGKGLGLATTYPISGQLDTMYELPGTYGIYSDAGTADRVRVMLTAFDDQMVPLVGRSAVRSLVREKTLFVRLGVISACLGMTDCGDGMTCGGGRCGGGRGGGARRPGGRPGREN